MDRAGRERCSCWKLVTDWWTETTDAVMLASPYLERGRLRWLLAAFNIVVAIDTGIFVYEHQIFMLRRKSAFIRRILISAALQLSVAICTLPLLLTAKLARYHILKVEILSSLAFSVAMSVIMLSNIRSYASLFWLCYLLAMMVMKFHLLAVITALAAFIPSVLKSEDLTYEFISPLHGHFHETTWLAEGTISCIFLLEFFAATSGFWYCYAFTCKVRAVRDGNVFSSGDFDPQLLAPSCNTLGQRLLGWWRRSTDVLFATSPVLAKCQRLSWACVMTVWGGHGVCAYKMWQAIRLISQIPGQPSCDAQVWLHNYFVLVAGTLLWSGSLMLLKRELASTGCLSQLLMEDLLLATLLLAPCFLHAFILRLVSNLGCDPVEISLLRTNCWSFGDLLLMQVIFVLAMARAHPVIVMCTVSIALALQLQEPRLDGRRFGRLQVTCALLVIAQLLDYYSLMRHFWAAVVQAHGSARGISECRSWQARSQPFIELAEHNFNRGSHAQD